MDEILAAILKDTYSLTQYRNRVRILKAYLVQSFFGGNPLPENQDTLWLKSLPQTLFQKFTKDNVYEIFTNLEKNINNLKVLTMHLAFDPDEASLNELGAHARTTLASPTLLLDIKLNPNLIAGAAFSWKGRLRDYSLKSKLEEKRQELSEEFRRFLR